MVKSFFKNAEYLTKQGFKPIFNIIDNMTSKSVKAYLESANIDLQPFGTSQPQSQHR